MKSKYPAIVVIAVLLVAVTSAWAQDQAHIKLQSLAEVEKQVVGPDGSKKQVREPAAKVVPGTEVIFTTLYENVSDKTAETAVITNPIPEQMIYVEGSVTGDGATVTFSIDNGKSYDTPAKLFVVDAAKRNYPARPSDYTHIRWTFESPLSPGAKGMVSFRAILK